MHLLTQHDRPAIEQSVMAQTAAYVDFRFNQAMHYAAEVARSEVDRQMGRIWSHIAGGLMPPGSPWQPLALPGQWAYTGQMLPGLAAPPAPPALFAPGFPMQPAPHAGATLAGMQAAAQAAAQQAAAASMAQQAAAASMAQQALVASAAAAARLPAVPVAPFAPAPAPALAAAASARSTGGQTAQGKGQAGTSKGSAKQQQQQQQGGGKGGKDGKGGKGGDGGKGVSNGKDPAGKDGAGGSKPGGGMQTHNNPLFEPEGATGKEKKAVGARTAAPHLKALNERRAAEAAARKEANGGKERWAKGVRAKPPQAAGSKGRKSKSKQATSREQLPAIPEGAEGTGEAEGGGSEESWESASGGSASEGPTTGHTTPSLPTPAEAAQLLKERGLQGGQKARAYLRSTLKRMAEQQKAGGSGPGRSM